MAKTRRRVGFVGAGRMASALGQGLLTSVAYSPEIGFLDPSEQAAESFLAAAPGSKRFHEAAELVEFADCLILAVKPQIMSEVLETFSGLVTPSHLVISVAAGIPLAFFQERLSCSRVVRVMPNTPCLVGAGASGVAFAEGVSGSDREWVQQLLKSVGEVAEVEEDQMDAVTAISGSGPAYVFLFAEALEEAGIQLGLQPELARQLAGQTLFGAATLMNQSQVSPVELRAQVTSPGGTTQAAIGWFEQHGLRSLIADAALAAAKRSRELSSE